MRRIRRNSKVSLVVVGVILALLGTMAWFTLQGTSDLTPNCPNCGAVGYDSFVLNSALNVASDGQLVPSSFKVVSMRSIAPPVVHPSKTKITVTNGGSVGWFSVSVKLCADGTACQEMIVAARGAGEKCWFERLVIGNSLIAQKEGLRIGEEYLEATRQGQFACSASNAPRSGWRSGTPSPRSLYQ